jgi:hypothetical protein
MKKKIKTKRPAKKPKISNADWRFKDEIISLLKAIKNDTDALRQPPQPVPGNGLANEPGLD